MASTFSGRRRGVLIAFVAALTLTGCTSPQHPLPGATGIPAQSIAVPLQAAACLAGTCVTVGATTAATAPVTEALALDASNHALVLPTPPLTSGSFVDASCASAYCLFAGTNASGNMLWRFTPSPATLANVPTIPGSGIVSVGCAPGGCAYVDSTRSGGTAFVSLAHPTRPVPLAVPPHQHVVAVRCATTSTCIVAFSGDGVHMDETLDGGASWMLLPTPDTWTSLLALSCGGPTTCHSIVRQGTTTLLATLTKGVWTSQAVPAGTAGLDCPTDATCVTVGGTVTGGGGVAWLRGTTISSTPLTYVPTALTAVGCDATACLAVGPTTLVPLRVPR